MFTVCRSLFAVRARTSHGAVRAFGCANPLDKPREHLFDVRRGMFQRISLPRSEKSQVPGQQNETNQFVGRTSSYVEELPEFSAGRSSTTLRDVGRDGSCGSSHLAGQAELLGMGISSGGAIDAQRQSLTALPYLQFPEVLHGATPFYISLAGATLAQEYYTKQVLESRAALTASGKRQAANTPGDSPC